MTAWPATEPTEVVLRAGHARLAIDLRGGGLRELVVGDWAVLDGYPAGAVAGGSRGAVLLPWPNRVRHGRWTWAGPGAAARRPIPSSSRTRCTAWSPGSPGPRSSRAPTGPPSGALLEPHPGYPFRLAAAVDYALTPDRARR